MRIRFQADADLDPAIGKGLLRREPAIDFQAAAGVIPDGTPDPAVLRLAAEGGRVLVTGDLRTMRVHFEEFIAPRRFSGCAVDPVVAISPRCDRGVACYLAELGSGRSAQSDLVASIEGGQVRP